MQYEVLGQIRVLRAGTPIRLGGPMAMRLLAALLVDAPRAVERDILIERLWGDDPPATATTALQVHVSRLRQVLEPGHRGGASSVLRTTDDGYGLVIDRAQIDSEHFESLVRQAEDFAMSEPERAVSDVESARALWRGRPWGALADEVWMRGEVSRLEELRRRADEQWGDVQLVLGRHDVIVDSLARAVAEEPLREHRWEQLMMALYRCGRQAEALRAFQDARRVLTDELGIEPSPALRALEQAVLVQDPDLDAPPRARPQRPRHNLPVMLTGLVGRDDDVVATRKALEESRLVTITGTAGCGKTRLALAVAEELVDRFDEGAWFVDLTAAASGDIVATHIATALGLRESDEHGPGNILALLQTFLRDRDVLLVLDNCEHVVAHVAAVVGSLLSTCPGVRVLATSRVIIGQVGETVQQLSPLPTPETDVAVEEVTSSPAVQLFLERASDAGASFDPTPEQLTTIGELCRFLEGVPLAIELVAMWTAALPPSEILERLVNRLVVMATDESLPERQRTLRTAIDWSYALLSDTERLAFRRLSVFPAGFTLGGAAAVVAGDPDATEAVIGLVARLVSSSLVRTYGPQVPARYRMLEAIREFAAEQLNRSGEAGQTRAHQFDYFAALARSSRRDEFFGPPNSETMAALDAEHDNIREALDRLIASRDREGAELLAGAMGTYWAERGHWGEGQRWITRALELPTDSRSPERARAFIALAQTTSSFAGIATRADELEQAVEICRNYDAPDQLGAALMYLSLARAWRREFPAMRAAFGEATQIAANLANRWVDTTLAVYDSLSLVLEGDRVEAHKGLLQGAAALLDLGDESLAARTLMYAGNISRLMGDLPAARRELEQSMEIARAQTMPGTYAHGTLALAQVAMDLGDADAPSLFVDCLAALEVIGDVRCTGVCQRSLGSLAIDKDQLDEALVWLRQSLEHLAAYDQRTLAIAIADIATIYQRHGEVRDAARLATAAQTLSEKPGMPLTSDERARIDAAVAATHTELHTNGAESPKRDDAVDLAAILTLARNRHPGTDSDRARTPSESFGLRQTRGLSPA
jgi:predicted ATPase/DNA-binding SARP family transcriptional activator